MNGVMVESYYEQVRNQVNNGEIKGIRLPKNIRQVGMPQGNCRIYIEDYVVTYLNRLAKPENTYARGAILLGSYQQVEGQGVLFISGAIEAQNLEFDPDEIVFSQEFWTEIYNEIKQHFSDLEVVGWFLSRMGFSTGLNDKIMKLHMENFMGKNKVLYMIDALEGEDTWYMLEHNTLKRQTGYYIYYTRNDDMQRYMMKQFNAAGNKEGQGEQRDREVLERYKLRLDNQSQVEHRTKKSWSGLLYIASGMLTLACLALGVTVINNYQRLQSLEVAFYQIEGKDVAEQDIETEVMVVEANVTPNKEALATTQTETTDETEPTTQTTTQTESTTQAETTTQTSTEAPADSTAVEAPAFPRYYVVQDGDTLSSISFMAYHTILYVDEIMAANHMEQGDEIQIGQQILLPDLP